jgi:putative CocE/NonD family hydrolase
MQPLERNQMASHSKEGQHRPMAIICRAALTVVLYCGAAAITLGPVVSALAADSIVTSTTAEEKLSAPGVYRGYDKEVYPKTLKSTQYVQGHDGTRLVLELNRPSLDGKNAMNEPLPVVLTSSRYGGGGSGGQGGEHMVKCGYVFATLQLRGSGNSFGSRVGDFTVDEAKDSAKVVEWLASQPWSTGKVAMMGGSYLGVIQLLTAAWRPKGLVALAPQVNDRDFYTLKFPNGVFSPESGYDGFVKRLDAGQLGRPDQPPQVVDRDFDGTPIPLEKATELRNRALAEHKANKYRDEIFGYEGGNYPAAPRDPVYRDSQSSLVGGKVFDLWSPAHYADAIRASGVHIYEFAGWYDGYVNQQLAEAVNLNAKIVIGPWGHGIGNLKDFDVMSEHQRWFDYQLKGINNGIQNEPRFYFYTRNATAGKEWQFSETWPLKNERRVKFRFQGPKSGTVNSVNDGLLVMEPASDVGKDDYTARYDISLFDGKFSLLNRRWDGDMRLGCDEKGLTYTTAPLTSDSQVTGHPVVEIFASTTEPDAYFFAFLEDVEDSGASRFVTDGKLKASHRSTDSHQPEDALSIPYHRSYQADVKPMSPGKAEKLVFDLFPTSYVFKAGHRIRVTIANANEATFPIPPEWKERRNVITVYRGGTQSSFISLPIIAAK